jgi:8-oxo-dGTP diphosphatase
VVLRHSQARSRKAWRADDRERPLLATGKHQADRLVPVLAAYDVRRLVSSSSTRCVQTLEPYAAASGHKLRTVDLFSEEDASASVVAGLMTRLTDRLHDRPASAGGVVVCTHRPVLPMVFDALGLDDPHLDTGEMVVLHLRKGRVRSAERHLAT